MPKYKTRNSFMSYEVYLKKRETTCHYNKGLWWMDPSGGQAIFPPPTSAHWKTNAIRSFQKAICADPHNEDAKYQLQILMTPPPKDISNCALLLDCSGCQWVNSQHR